MSEKKKTPDEILEEAKKMIGTETIPITSPYPVEYEPIRRYCLMVDDENPLFLDPAFAKKTKYGDVILPPFAPFGIMSRGSPSMMASLTDQDNASGSIMPPTPGNFLINMAQEWEWFKPAMLGDFLSTKTRLADVYIKPISIDPKAFWIVLEMQISNQHGDSICIVRNILLCHRSPEEVANSIA